MALRGLVDSLVVTTGLVKVQVVGIHQVKPQLLVQQVFVK
jgi:hypothetical protein